ncbi:protein-export chaperone SecB [Marinicella sp. S1101]|uniref:protein-export chaperone SecB n=1 Tax=Marinicella marina TaxID=2996016 RepID=UPI002260ABDE|nr:protein-export chaperone SecB [Marinicella marina]MCX7554343.1 protein-export chaperone SecB [Marinicella marina]MDJ1138666.1 protein-export chaperone SecB [Marinicella marina]
MTEENKVAAQAEQQAPTMSLQKIYTKDVSFEAPNAPQVFNEQGQPDIKLNMNQKVNKLDENNFEVALTATVTCTVNEKTAYLVEVCGAGIFGMQNFDDQALHQTLGVYCPNVIFPYVRQQISDMVLAGGFQPLLLQPVNFEQMYAQQMRQAQEQAASSTKQ